jgi:hypothetical protein
MVVGHVADVSEVHTTTIFRVEVYMLISYCVLAAFCFEKDEYVANFANPRTQLTLVINQ